MEADSHEEEADSDAKPGDAAVPAGSAGQSASVADATGPSSDGNALNSPGAEGGETPGAAETSATPRVEQFASLNMLRHLLPSCQSDTSAFHSPPGWTEEPVHGGRRTKLVWVQRDPETGELLRSYERRQDLEEALEREHSAAGGAWLGQLVGGLWEIRPRAVLPAIAWVLQGLVATGAVTMLPPEKSGKAHALYLIANQYYAGEAFPRAATAGQKRPRAEVEDEVEEEDLADIELERLRNIERNNAILKQLGLA